MPEEFVPVGKVRPLVPNQEQKSDFKPVGKIRKLAPFDYNTQLEHETTVRNVNEADYDQKIQEIDQLPEFGAMDAIQSALAPASMAIELRYSKGEKEKLKDLYLQGADDKTFNMAKAVMGSGVNYYFDDNGLPVPLKSGQKPPDGKSIASIWGTQSEAEDDGLITTAAKNIYSAIPGIVNNIADVAHLPYGLIAGKEADWYTDLKNSTEAIKFKTSTASQAPIFNSEGIDSWDDLFESGRFNITADNVVGTASQLVGTVLEFMAGGEIAKGIGIGGKAISSLASQGTNASVLTKLAAKTPYFVGGYMTNLGEALDAADEAGVKGRDKYAVASLVTIPVSAIEMLGGLEAKFMNNALAQKEKSQMVKSLVKGWAETNGKEVSQKTLKELYEATNVATTSLAAKLGKEFIETGAGEATEEVLQNMTQKASQQIYDHLFAEDKEVGKGRYGTEVVSPESVAEYFNDAIGGLLGGAGGNILNAKSDIRKAKAQLQSEQAYTRIANGKASELKMEIESAYKAGQITETEKNTAFHKVDKYQEYHDAVKGLDLTDDEKRRVSDLNWTGENLKAQMEGLKNNPRAKDETSIEYKQLSVLEKIYKAASKEIEETLTKPLADQQLSVPTAIQKDIENKEEQTPSGEKKKGFSFKTKTVAPEGEVQKEQTSAESKQEMSPEEEAINKERKLFISKIKKGTEKDADAFLKEADEKGITNEEVVQAVADRKFELKESKKKERLASSKETVNKSKSDIDYLESEIESQRKIIQKIKKERDFNDIDLSDNSEFIEEQRSTDKKFDERLSTHESIVNNVRLEGKPATSGQIEAVKNLVEVGILDDTTDLEQDLQSMSYDITEGVRRIQYLKSQTSDSKEIDEFNDMLKALYNVQKLADEKAKKESKLKSVSSLSFDENDNDETAKKKVEKIKQRKSELEKEIAKNEKEKSFTDRKTKLNKLDASIRNAKTELRELTEFENDFNEFFDLSEKPVEPTPDIQTELSDEVKDTLVVPGSFEEAKDELLKSNKPLKGVFIDRGKKANNALSVEVNGKTYKIASSGDPKKTGGSFGQKAKKEIGKEVEVRLVKKEDWNPEGKIVNKLTNLPYGDKIEIINQKGEVIGNLQESYSKKEKAETEIAKAVVEEKNNYSTMADEEITKLDAFQEFKKKNSKWSDKKLIEYFKKCK